MITKEFLTQRQVELTNQLEQSKAQMYAVQGALQDVTYILAKFDEDQAAEAKDDD